MSDQHQFASELAHEQETAIASEQEAMVDAQQVLLDGPPPLVDEPLVDEPLVDEPLVAAEHEPIEGKVAEIVSETELAINVGTNDGVTKGMVFAVLAATPLEIRDPDTGNVLTVLDRPKTKVKVSEIGETYSLCTTYRTRHIGGSILQDMLAVGTPSRTARETLRTDESWQPMPISSTESYVKIGDRVRQVVE